MKHLTTLLLTVLVLGGCGKETETHLRCVVLDAKPDDKISYTVSIKKSLTGKILDITSGTGSFFKFEEYEEFISWNDYAGRRLLLNKETGILNIIKKDAKKDASGYFLPGYSNLAECTKFEGI